MANEMRDRLVELVQDALFQHAHYVGKERQRALEAETEAEHSEIYESIKTLQEFIADYIIADGWIRPPCKVGETVYCIYGEQVIQGTVRLIRPFISQEEIVFKGNIICEVVNIFFDDDTIKEEIELYVVFEKPYGCERVAYLTKSEAEQNLNEMRGEISD